MKKWILAVGFALALVTVFAGGAWAQAVAGVFDFRSSGFVMAQPVGAGSTCYTLDAGFQYYGSPTNRADVLSVFVKHLDDGRLRVCYLRPLVPGGGAWLQ